MTFIIEIKEAPDFILFQCSFEFCFCIIGNAKLHRIFSISAFSVKEANDTKLKLYWNFLFPVITYCKKCMYDALVHKYVKCKYYKNMLNASSEL